MSNVTGDNVGVYEVIEGNDSGIDEENDENDDDNKCKHEDLSTRRLKKQTSNFGGFRRRSSIWSLFSRKSKRRESRNVPMLTDQQKGASGKIPVDRTRSCPPLLAKKDLVLTGTKRDESSRTSDLGDSVPSTPVSTISSNTGFLEIPGIVGLHNLGNTCYFNAILQCMAHIDIISEYFAMEHFMNDLATLNKVLQRRKISRFKAPRVDRNNNEVGQLIYMVGLLIKSLWNNEIYSMELLQEVMDVVQYYNKTYNVYEQQDALEFFMWLIDKIHAESNILPKRKSMKNKEIKKKKPQTQEEKAVASFASFTKYKQSYIQGLFLSQYQSVIPCTKCAKSSSTFDPYINLSLEIPSQPKRVLFATAVRSTGITLRYGFEFQRKGTLHELRAEIVDRVDITRFVLVEIKYCGITRILRNDNPLSILPNDENSLYAVELRDEVHRRVVNYGDNELLLVVSNVERCGCENRRFGLPLVIRVSDRLSFKKLQILIRKQIETNVRDFLVTIIKENQVRLGLRVIGENKSTVFLSNDLEYPLLQPSIVNSMEYDDNLQINCLYVVAEWEPNVSGWFMEYYRHPMTVDDPSCITVRQRTNERFIVDIHDCLRLQTKEEKLPEMDSWKCTSCSQEQKGITKKLSLWSLPDVLVLHLKRFDQIQHFKNKSTTLVRFPVHGLDLSPYVATPTGEVNKNCNSWYHKESVKLQYQSPPENEQQCLYDLRAVCNHLGSDLNQGHYTATCYNSVNDTWYGFDDRNVRTVSETNIESPEAYILFYQRRELSSRVPEKLSVPERSEQHAHWSFQMHAPKLHVVERDDDELY